MVRGCCGLGVPPSCLPHCQSIILLNAYPPDVPHTLHTPSLTHSTLHMLHTPLTLLVCQSHCWFSVFVFVCVCVFCLFELCRDAGPGRGEGVVLSRLRDAFHSYPVKYSHLSSASARLALPCLTLTCQAPKATDEFC